MNKVILAGYLGKDVEIRYTTENKAVATLNIGTRESKDKTEWHRCVAWEKTAEFINKYFKKGSYILVTGHLQTKKYEDKDGKTVYTTEVIIESAEFGGNKETKAETNQFDQAPINDDDLPF